VGPALKETPARFSENSESRKLQALPRNRITGRRSAQGAQSSRQQRRKKGGGGALVSTVIKEKKNAVLLNSASVNLQRPCRR
jgi:hypothetical protein